MISGRLMREDLTNWKKSMTCSEFTLSNMAWIQMNAPVLPIPSLAERERGVRGSHGTEVDILAEDSDRFVLCVPLQFVEVSDQLQQ